MELNLLQSDQYEKVSLSHNKCQHLQGAIIHYVRKSDYSGNLDANTSEVTLNKVHGMCNALQHEFIQQDDTQENNLQTTNNNSCRISKYTEITNNIDENTQKQRKYVSEFMYSSIYNNPCDDDIQFTQDSPF